MALYRDRENHPRVKCMHLQSSRLGKPRCGLQIFDTRMDLTLRWISLSLYEGVVDSYSLVGHISLLSILLLATYIS